jgi:hypothetical protein
MIGMAWQGQNGDGGEPPSFHAFMWLTPTRVAGLIAPRAYGSTFDA